MATYVGNVIRILDEFTLIIDAGSRSVSVGDKVQVYEIVDTICDLDGNPLGDFSYVKDELDVIQVEDRFSVCKKNKSIKRITASALALSPLLDHTYTEKVPLPVNSSEFSPLPSVDQTIHVGDKVKKI